MRPTETLHRLPTHLGVRDPVLWSLNDSQVVKLGAGLLLAAVLLRQAALPFTVRAALALAAVIGAAACALVRIDGRPLEEWLLLAGRYCARPRLLVWRPRRARHPWARDAVAPGPTGPSTGTRYCLRQIQVRRPRPADERGH